MIYYVTLCHVILYHINIISWHAIRSLRRSNFPSSMPYLGTSGDAMRLASALSPYVYIYIYIHTYIHACIHTYIHACIHTYIHTYILICKHKYHNTSNANNEHDNNNNSGDAMHLASAKL